MSTLLDEKDPGETFDILFDFGFHVLNIASATVTCTTIVGIDTANIALATPTWVGGAVTQTISGGGTDNTYKLRCVVTATEGTFVLTCIQPVRTL